MYPNTLKIHMVCVTYTTNYFFQHSELFYLFILFCFKKKRNKSKTWPLTTNKKKYGSVISCKASFIFNWKHFIIHYGYLFFYLYINGVELFISHSWRRNLVTQTGLSGNQKRGGCTSSLNKQFCLYFDRILSFILLLFPLFKNRDSFL